MAKGLCGKCHNPLDGTNKAYCKACFNVYQNERRRANAEQANAYQREWNKNNVERKKMYARVATIRKYGFSLEDAKELAVKEDFECEICHVSLERGQGRGKLAIDHVHETGEFRGFLCQPCNMMLGFAKDSEWVLSQAIAYLRRHSLKLVDPVEETESEQGA